MKTNTKKSFLKLAMTIMAAFMFTAAMGQTYPTTIMNDYSAVDEVIQQTTGVPLTLYVAPDPAYHPDYAIDAEGNSGNTGLNETAQWRWVYGFSWENLIDDPASDPAWEVKEWTGGENYVEISAANLPSVGATRTYWVKEKVSATGMEDTGTGQSKTILVTGQPDGTIVGANTTTTWDVVNAGIEYQYCGTGVTDNLTLNFTEASATSDNYAYNITAQRTAYDANGTPLTGQENIAVTGFDLSVAATNATFVTKGSARETASMVYYSDAEGTNFKTKYVFTLADVASRTSTLSNYRAGSTNTFYSPTTSTTVTYWLLLPPVTGPIYHIPNNFAL